MTRTVPNKEHPKDSKEATKEKDRALVVSVHQGKSPHAYCGSGTNLCTNVIYMSS